MNLIVVTYFLICKKQNVFEWYIRILRARKTPVTYLQKVLHKTDKSSCFVILLYIVLSAVLFTYIQRSTNIVHNNVILYLLEIRQVHEHTHKHSDIGNTSNTPHIFKRTYFYVPITVVIIFITKHEHLFLTLHSNMFLQQNFINK